MRKNSEIIVGIIAGIIFTIATTVLAASAFDSKEVPYDNTTSKLTSTNVQDAVDELYAKTNNCPEGYSCEKKISKCIKAENLHKENCAQTNASFYCSAAGLSGKEIEYGKKPSGGTLQAGDAYTCDVNGDGTYDEATERFYYVTEMDSDTAVLVYYNNTTAGVPDNTTSSLIAYDLTHGTSGNINNYGPVSAVVNLPTTSQWSNVKLTNTERQIRNEQGGTTTSAGNLPVFSYSGYAARLLTAEEVNDACGITVGSATTGELDTCNYLMENTKYSNDSMGKYGYWLESPRLSSANYAWGVNGSYRIAGYLYAYYALSFGVRPAIEVLKSDIDYK